MKDYEVAKYVANGYSSNIDPDEIFEDLLKFGVSEKQYERVHDILQKTWVKTDIIKKEDYNEQR